MADGPITQEQNSSEIYSLSYLLTPIFNCFQTLVDVLRSFPFGTVKDAFFGLYNLAER